MSFRELRNFTEMMKALGYQRLISVENFRTPNFELVANVLFWLTIRYDPSAEISDDISDEDKRVEFLKSVAQLMAQKARIKLNLKSLYKADGYAVKELLKICNILYAAYMAEMNNGDTKNSAASIGASEASVGQKLEGIKQARDLATQIVETGASLYNLLGKEEELKQSRDRALAFVDSISRNLESDESNEVIERSIREQVNIIADNITELEKMSQDLEKDHVQLKQKIERKAADLDRAEKRYRTLKKVRPAFMEEYDNLERELKVVYAAFLEKFRNLNYLESEISKYHAAELERKNESDRQLKRMQKRLRDEELRILRGEQDVDEDKMDDSVWDSGKDDSGKEDDEPSRGRPVTAEGKNRKGAGGKSAPAKDPKEKAKVVGRMDAKNDASSDSESSGGEEGSSESGSGSGSDDDDGDGDGDGDDDDDDDDEEEEEAEKEEDYF